MKKTSILAFCAGIFLLLPGSALAFEVKSGNSVFITENETIEGNLYVAGQSITIDGMVNGDVICGGRSININGAVKGDVICAGQNININGTVEGSIRIAGEIITVNGPISHGLQFLGSTLFLGSKAEIGWDAFVLAESANLQGKINGDFHGSLSRAEISGEIKKDAKLRLDPRAEVKDALKITDSAILGGNLFYTAGHSGEIMAGAKIAGQTGFTPSEKLSKKIQAKSQLWTSIIGLFSLLISGLVLVSLFKSPVEKITDLMQEKPAQAIGWGAIILLITPIVCLVMFATLIGIPLSLIVLVSWLIGLYLAKVIGGIALGRIFMKKLNPEKSVSLMAAMIIGLILFFFFTRIPIIGWSGGLLAVFWGLGGFWLMIKK